MMFHNLIKTHHDGVIITEEDNIIFHNLQINQIFDITLDNDHKYSHSSLSKIDNTKQIKQNLKRTKL